MFYRTLAMVFLMAPLLFAYYASLRCIYSCILRLVWNPCKVEEDTDIVSLAEVKKAGVEEVLARKGLSTVNA